MQIELSNGLNHVWQWDRDIAVTVPEGVDSVHFRWGGRAVEIPVENRQVVIPPELMQRPRLIRLWTYTPEHTLDMADIPVQPKNKPSDYAYTPTEVKTWEQLDERITALEKGGIVSGVSSVNGKSGAVELTAEDVGAATPKDVTSAVEAAAENLQPKGDYITQDGLQSATDAALAQAKASGEFDGAKGDTGDTGPQGPKGNTGDTGPQGPPGADGAGMNITGATVGQIAKIAAVDENGVPTAWVPVDMPSGGASEGNALTSSEKNLILTLFKTIPYTADVNKTVKSLEKVWTGAATYYTVTYSLTSVTANNQETRIIEGGTLEIDLTPDAGTEITNVVVTMSGVDITEESYKNNRITISNVSGNVSIIATAASTAYTAIEYLQGDGNAYINTGYAPAVGDLVECKFAETAVTWSYIFSMWKGGSALYGFITRMAYTAGASTGFTRRLPSDANDYNDRVVFNCEQNTVYTIKETEPGKATIYNEAGEGLLTLVDEKASTFASPTNPIFLWTQSYGDTPYGNVRCKTRIYAFKIKDAYGETKMDLIPVLDGNGVACIYDKVAKSFLYDAAGGNTFIAGGTI